MTAGHIKINFNVRKAEVVLKPCCFIAALHYTSGNALHYSVTDCPDVTDRTVTAGHIRDQGGSAQG
jgi:hypothetical protein